MDRWQLFSGVVVTVFMRLMLVRRDGRDSVNCWDYKLTDSRYRLRGSTDILPSLFYDFLLAVIVMRNEGRASHA